MLGIENIFTVYNISTNYHIGISSLLGIIVLGIILLKYMPSEANLIKNHMIRCGMALKFYYLH